MFTTLVFAAAVLAGAQERSAPPPTSASRPKYQALIQCVADLRRCVRDEDTRKKLNRAVAKLAKTYTKTSLQSPGNPWPLNSYANGTPTQVAKATIYYADEEAPTPSDPKADGAAAGSVLGLVLVEDSDYEVGGLTKGWQLLFFVRNFGASVRSAQSGRTVVPAGLYTIAITGNGPDAVFDSTRGIREIPLAALTRQPLDMPAPSADCMENGKPRPCFVKGAAMISRADAELLRRWDGVQSLQEASAMFGLSAERLGFLQTLAAIDVVWIPCEPNGCCCGGTDCHP